METQYGLPTLGQIQAFLRKIVGDEALFEIAEQKMREGLIPNKEYASMRKSWDRFCAEETKNHEKVKDYEEYAVVKSNSNIAILTEEFLESLEQRYGLPYKVSLEIEGFCDSLIDLYRGFNPFRMMNNLSERNGEEGHYEGGKLDLVAENKTARFVSFVLKIQIMLAVGKFCNDYGREKVSDFLKLYSKHFSYAELFDRLRQEQNCKSLSELYEKLDSSSENNPFERIIKKTRKTEKSPGWSDLKLLLPHCSAELKKHIIAKYLLSNTEQALQGVFQISKAEIDGIKNAVKQFLNNEGFSESLEKLLTAMFTATAETDEEECDPFCGKTNGKASGFIKIAYNFIIHRHQQKNPLPLDKIDNLIDHIKEFAPHSSAFFVPYFKAYTAVTKRDFDKAMELFNEAFLYKHFAGDYLVEFLEMAFCFANYYKANWTVTRKSFKKEDNIQNPVNCDAKMFKNFGYAIGAFPSAAEDSYQEAYKNLEYFYACFPPECFIDLEEAKRIQKWEFENRDKIKIETDGREKSDFVETHPYEVLSKLKGKNRSKLLPEKELFTLNQDHNAKQKDLCPPLVLCIRYSLDDERLLSLAEEWLSDTENPVDTFAISYNGVSALCEALKVYMRLKLDLYLSLANALGKISRTTYAEFEKSGKTESVKKKYTHKASKEFLDYSAALRERLGRYERIVRTLVDRTDWEHELRFGIKIPVLARAIECYDFDLVKKIAEKIPEDEFDGYAISEQELSPLMYVINRKEPVSFGLEEYIRKQKDIHVSHSIPASTFGLTREEAIHNHLYENPMPEGMDFTMYHMEHWEEQLEQDEVEEFCYRYGDETTWKKQIAEYDKMIDYFLSRTKNVDSFTKSMSIQAQSRNLDNTLKPSIFQSGYTNSTVLIVAARANDSDTCRKLLRLGAKPETVDCGYTLDYFGKTCYQMKNTFIYALIDSKSWETLEMFLTEFSDMARPLMENDEFGLNPFVIFAMKVQDYFIWTGRDKREWRPIVRYLADLFIAAGANPDEKTVCGSARELLELNIDASCS